MMQRFVLHQNIALWRARAANTSPPKERALFAKLITQAEQELAELESASLHPHFRDEPAVQPLAQQIVDDAVRLGNAQFGNVQLYAAQAKALVIVAQRNFRKTFLDYFAAVQCDDGSACGRAFGSGGQINIEDVAADDAFKPHLDIARDTGFRSVQSAPLRDKTGAIFGMLSIHYSRARRFGDEETCQLGQFAHRAGRRLEAYLSR